MDKTTLGNRMKAAEGIYRNYLPTKQYYILRLDGRSFSKYTKNLEAFDAGMIEDMQLTMENLCKEIQGAQMGYTQSDEISIIFTDMQSQDSDIWFGGNIQKIVSIAASIATATFNSLRLQRILSDPKSATYDVFKAIKENKLAQFDARVFSMSQRHEALNAILWRQQDASKNSIQMLARTLFSHKECQNKNGSQLQDMMMLEKGVNWNDIDTVKKRGTACYRKIRYCNNNIIPTHNNVNEPTMRTEWFMDKEIPIFSKDWTWFEGKVI